MFKIHHLVYLHGDEMLKSHCDETTDFEATDYKPAVIPLKELWRLFTVADSDEASLYFTTCA